MIKLAIILMLGAFVVLLAYWVVRTEEDPKKKPSFFDPNKSYNKAKEMGLKLPGEYNDALPGV